MDLPRKNEAIGLNTSSSKLLFKGLKIQYKSSLNFHLKDKNLMIQIFQIVSSNIEERPSVSRFFNASQKVYGPIVDLSVDFQSDSHIHNMFVLELIMVVSHIRISTSSNRKINLERI